MPDPARAASCPHCDLLQDIPILGVGEKAFCARCAAELARGERWSTQHDAALAITTLLLLVVANTFPILSLELSGRAAVTTVISGAQALWSEARYELATVVILVAIVIPVVHAASVLVRCWLLRNPINDDAARRWARLAAFIEPWGMPEVYLIGALVAFVKLDDLATVIVGPALYAFAATSILTALSATDRESTWRHLRARQGA